MNNDCFEETPIENEEFLDHLISKEEEELFVNCVDCIDTDCIEDANDVDEEQSEKIDDDDVEQLDD